MKIRSLISMFVCPVSFCVKVEDYISSERPINDDVVQGSVLGPILFLVYVVNDIPAETGVKLSFPQMKRSFILPFQLRTLQLLDSNGNWNRSLNVPKTVNE